MRDEVLRAMSLGIIARAVAVVAASSTENMPIRSMEGKGKCTSRSSR